MGTCPHGRSTRALRGSTTAQPLFVQREIQIGIMYILYTTFHDGVVAACGLANTLPDSLVRLLASGMTDTVDALALMPLERVQTLLQLRETPLAQDGPGELYCGLPSAITRNIISNGGYFLLLPWASEGYGILDGSVVGRRGRACIPAGLRGRRFEDFAAGMGSRYCSRSRPS